MPALPEASIYKAFVIPFIVFSEAVMPAIVPAHLFSVFTVSFHSMSFHQVIYPSVSVFPIRYSDTGVEGVENGDCVVPIMPSIKEYGRSLITSLLFP